MPAAAPPVRLIRLARPSGAPQRNPENAGGIPLNAGYRRSVLNVEGIAEGLVEPDPAVEVEVADGF